MPLIRHASIVQEPRLQKALTVDSILKYSIVYQAHCDNKIPGAFWGGGGVYYINCYEGGPKRVTLGRIKRTMYRFTIFSFCEEIWPQTKHVIYS